MPTASHPQNPNSAHLDLGNHHLDFSSVSPLEQEVLDEYTRLARNMERVRGCVFVMAVLLRLLLLLLLLLLLVIVVGLLEFVAELWVYLQREVSLRSHAARCWKLGMTCVVEGLWPCLSVTVRCFTSAVGGGSSRNWSSLMDLSHFSHFNREEAVTSYILPVFVSRSSSFERRFGDPLHTDPKPPISISISMTLATPYPALLLRCFLLPLHPPRPHPPFSFPLQTQFN